MNEIANRQLFGGALTIWLPVDHKDISDIREVPDNQEVFTHVVTDQSVIVEILEYVEEPDEQALRVHFDEVAGKNEAYGLDSQIIEAEKIDLDQLTMNECESVWYITGQQKIAKFKEGDDAKNKVNIHMALYRLPSFSTDILVSFNDPLIISSQSSSNTTVPVSTQPWTTEQFKQIVLSLKIIDTGLFGS